jgi:uncharacterized protein YndB with AHSA1/START domain
MQPQANRDAVFIEIEIGAPPERVFRALSDAAELSIWWNEQGVNNARPWQVEARLGGLWKTGGTSQGHGDWETWGEIIEFDPPRVLAMTWNERLDKPRPFGQTVVRYELEPTASGTKLRLTHSGFASHREAFDDYSKGWHPVLGMLRDYFVTLS